MGSEADFFDLLDLRDRWVNFGCYFRMRIARNGAKIQLLIQVAGFWQQKGCRI